MGGRGGVSPLIKKLPFLAIFEMEVASRYKLLSLLLLKLLTLLTLITLELKIGMATDQ